MTRKSEVFAPSQPVASPCISICSLDDHGVCMGCHRTVEEITHWLDFSAEKRAKIMARIQQASG